MKLITSDLIEVVAHDIAMCDGERPEVCMAGAEAALLVAVPMIVRRCLRHIDAHHDDFIDGHNGKDYFEIVDEILIKVKETLRELIEEKE